MQRLVEYLALDFAVCWVERTIHMDQNGMDGRMVMERGWKVKFSLGLTTYINFTETP